MHERDGAMGFACQESFETELAVFEARQLPATRKSMADNIDNDAIVKVRVAVAEDTAAPMQRKRRLRVRSEYGTV
ncbi:unnamed protein product [Symbiodinium natans]|uniref:Uncharacterized protein n=1 Tax=Symbiodinium natans TaxID=878477 RepID=A0A812QEU5_9DINO|nr:unnamed protein product [Symbiodinium natans]